MPYIVQRISSEERAIPDLKNGINVVMVMINNKDGPVTDTLRIRHYENCYHHCQER